jgi:hypothetical protein
MTEDGIYTRYIMDVVNWSEYPAEFFAPRPDLPPCGLNHQASRVWVRVLDESGTLVHEFCELSAPSQLQGLWHGVRGGSDPPNLRVEIWDRECDMTYRSNMVFGAVPTAGRSWGVLKSAFK